LSALVLLVLLAAVLRSCAATADDRPSVGVNTELQTCMQEQGWVGIPIGQRLEFDLGERDEEDFERALRRCDERGG
jgi:hypothetical protein